MTTSNDKSATFDAMPTARPGLLIAIILLWTGLYIALTSNGERETWRLILDNTPIEIHRTLLVVGAAALWIPPLLGFTYALRVARRRRAVASRRSPSVPHDARPTNQAPVTTCDVLVSPAGQQACAA